MGFMCEQCAHNQDSLAVVLPRCNPQVDFCYLSSAAHRRVLAETASCFEADFIPLDDVCCRCDNTRFVSVDADDYVGFNAYPCPDCSDLFLHDIEQD